MLVVLQPCKDRIGRDPAGFGLGVSVNARRDAWESDRPSLFLSGQPLSLSGFAAGLAQCFVASATTCFERRQPIADRLLYVLPWY
jgi:hypothetical protein